MRRRLLCLLLAALLLTATGCANWEEPSDPLGELSEFYGAENETPEPEPLTTFTLPYFAGESLDPVTTTEMVQSSVGALLYEKLFELDEHYVLRPLLADSCAYDAEQRVYTLTLRSGVTFSDGSALTARDVAATLEQARQSQRYAARLAEVSSVRAQGDTVRITMSTDLATLAWRLDIPIVKAGTESDTVPVGTGPYVFAASDSGAYLEQNPSWWQQKALPLRRIELLHCKDRDTMLYAFSSREVQLLPLDLTGTGASGVSASGDYTDAPTSVMQFLGFNTRRAPFSDAALRQAVSAAADRQALVDSCLLGHGSAAQFPLSPPVRSTPRSWRRRTASPRSSSWRRKKPEPQAMPETPVLTTLPQACMPGYP